jgi:hypothetical protein
MQSIKGFCVSGLWKTEYCAAALGAIQNCPVQIAAGEKVSYTQEDELPQLPVI